MSNAHRAQQSTADPSYAERLASLEGARWKRVLDVQAPYRRNLRRLRPGRTLDVGCGIGRNLVALSADSVGVDHNADAVRRARLRGLDACTVDEFSHRRHEQAFDTLLLAHVVEHLTEDEADALLEAYLPCIRPGGQVIVITPQERGWRTDPTHVRFVDLDASQRLVQRHGLLVSERRSFPFPRPVGHVFAYNEFVLVARREAPSAH